MERSKDLLTKFYSVAFSLKIRSLLIRTTAFILFLGSFLLTMFLSYPEMPFLYKLIVSALCTLVLPGLFMVFASPITDIAVNLLYLKTREVKGETPYQRSLSPENSFIEQGIKFSAKRKVYTALALVGSILVASFSYLIIVPPFEATAKIDRPKFEKIPDSENAWIEYDLATQGITPISMRLGNISSSPYQEEENYYTMIRDTTLELTKTEGFKSLHNAAKGEVNLNQEALELLDRHKGALDHLLLGVKRPKAQYYIEAPSSGYTPPSVIQHRALITIACAQAQRLHLEGKTSEAIELALAAYRMSTDLARDPNAVLIQAIGSVIGRQVTRETLFSLINSNTTNADTDLEIARRISEIDSLMPNAYEPYIQDVRADHASLEEKLVKRTSSEEEKLRFIVPYNTKVGDLIAACLPGLRIRLFNSFIQLSQYYSKGVRPSAENWDFPAAEAANKDFMKPSWRMFPTNMFSYVSFSGHPYVLGIMKSLYLDRCIGSTLATFAACSAYKKAHGEFPATLELAMAEAKMPMPTDLATKKAIGYRLENGTPVVWFAGLDGKDNNGQTAYEAPRKAVATEGKDLIFVYGKPVAPSE